MSNPNNFKDQRERTERHFYGETVQIKNGESETHAESLDLSTTGLKIITASKMEQGAHVNVMIHDDLILKATVVWSQQDVEGRFYHTGLKFIELTKEQKLMIHILINNLKGSVVREMTVSPDFHSAFSLSINALRNVLKQQLPFEKIPITIRHEGDKIILIINPPEGEKLTILSILKKFGQFLSNEISLEDFVEDQIVRAKIEHDLDMANASLKYVEKLLKIEKEKNRALEFKYEDFKKIVSTSFNKVYVSEQQYKVLELLQEAGATYYSVACALDLSENTVKSHVRYIKALLGCKLEKLKRIDMDLIGIKKQKEISGH